MHERVAHPGADGATGVVLIHGAGDTSAVWQDVRYSMARLTMAVDLPGRGSRPADITTWDPDDAGSSVADEVRASALGEVILVAHSAGGVLTPTIAARLGVRVRHIVYVAGLIADEGRCVIDVIFPDQREQMASSREQLRRSHRGQSYISAGGSEKLPRTLAPLRSRSAARAIDSMRLMFHPISWQGVPRDLPRTFVRCTRDSIQPRAMQQKLIDAAGAQSVLALESDHNAPRDQPERLAEIIEDIAAQYDRDPGGA